MSFATLCFMVVIYFYTSISVLAGEKRPMAVLCDHELSFYTVCGGSGGGCVETSCDIDNP